MRGRKPKPTYLKVVDGNAGRRPLNDSEPVPKANLERQAPHWMSDTQKEVYVEALGQAPEGLLKDLDQSTFVGWVIAFDNFRQAADSVNRYGQFVKSGKQGIPMQNPAMAVMNKQNLIMAKLAAEMGFTPSSRSRVKLDGPGKGARSNPFANLKTFGEDDD